MRGEFYLVPAQTADGEGVSRIRRFIWKLCGSGNSLPIRRLTRKKIGEHDRVKRAGAFIGELNLVGEDFSGTHGSGPLLPEQDPLAGSDRVRGEGE